MGFIDLIGSLWTYTLLFFKFLYETLIFGYEITTVLFIGIINKLMNSVLGITTNVSVTKTEEKTVVKYANETTFEWVWDFIKSRFDITSIKFWIVSTLSIIASLHCSRFEPIWLKSIYVLGSILLGKWYLYYYLVWYIMLRNSCFPLNINKSAIQVIRKSISS